MLLGKVPWGGMVVVLCTCLLLRVCSCLLLWGGMVVVLCTCLLLPVWKGCPFWLSVIRSSYHARVGGLAQALFGRLGSSAPRFLHFSHFSCLASVYLCVDGMEACAFQPLIATLGPSIFRKSRSSPLHVVLSIKFHYFLCSLPLPLFLRG